jgi:NADPH:quinone reductase-like Zn-dependent oxidoreductase
MRQSTAWDCLEGDQEPVLAAMVTRFDKLNPLAALTVGERERPTPHDDWTVVQIKAAALNHHDLWSLRGVGLSEDQLPRVLGCDGAGIDADGNEVVIHAVIASVDAGGGDETLDPARSLLSEGYDGTLAEFVAVPRWNLVPKPASLTFEEAACLPTAWLTAFRMIFTKAQLEPASTVLVQGAGGGVGSALIVLAKSVGHRVWVTARSERTRDAALGLGADAAFEPGTRLPERVDAVFETVGEATWAHSLKSLRPGGVVVISGATSGAQPPAELARIFWRQLRVHGSTMGSKTELAALLRVCDLQGIRPVIDRVVELQAVHEGLADLLEASPVGKIVVTPT